MSKLALDLIEEAKRTKSKTLDLGMCGLRTIPPALFELEWLEELSLCNEYWDHEKGKLIKSTGKGKPNIINDLPNDFVKLTRLNTLKIRGDNSDISNIKILKTLRNSNTLTLALVK